MDFQRTWAMPNKNTFSILPINQLISELILQKTLMKPAKIIDPFCNESPFKDKCISNDLDPAITADYHKDALEFIKQFDTNEVDMVLFDPPYSPRQVSECYKKMGKSVNMQTTQASFWSNMKKEIGRAVKPGGVVVSCCWNSGGIGKKYGFKIIRVLLVPHGGWHNDTIVTVEEKIAELLDHKRKVLASVLDGETVEDESLLLNLLENFGEKS